jgi:phosphohistidine phosphatase SixA
MNDFVVGGCSGDSILMSTAQRSCEFPPSRSRAFAKVGALERLWDELYPAEQARIMRLLIERIDVAPDGISVTLHAAGIRSLVAELASERAAERAMMEAAE